MYVVRTGLVDGGGLFFPGAINQLFTGLYFMEVCLIGLFFLVRDQHGHVACEAQGIVMAVTLGLTVCYQIWLSHHLGRLYVHAPVLLEAEADSRDRDREYERARLWEPAAEESTPPALIQPRGKSPAPRVDFAPPRIRIYAPEFEEAGSPPRSPDRQESTRVPGPDGGATDRLEPSPASEHMVTPLSGMSTGSQFQRRVSIRSRHVQAQQHRDGQAAKHILARMHRGPGVPRSAYSSTAYTSSGLPTPATPGHMVHTPTDPISRVIMEHNDELEDLTASERDTLISVAFEHPVLQASTVGPTEIGQPVVWIPTDELGISTDEIMRTRRLSDKHVAIEDRGAFFDRRGKIRVERSPPDMSEFALVMGDL